MCVVGIGVGVSEVGVSGVGGGVKDVGCAWMCKSRMRVVFWHTALDVGFARVLVSGALGYRFAYVIFLLLPVA